MSDPDVPRSEMPGLPHLRWISQQPDASLLDMIVAGQPLPPGAPHHLHVVANRLAELGGPAGPGELAAETMTISAFRSIVSPASSSPVPPARSTRRSRRPLAAVRIRLATALAAIVVVVGGTAAAYAGVLPAPLQNFAHRLVDAPAAGHSGAHRPGGTARDGSRSPRGAPGQSGAKPKHGRKANPDSHGKGKQHGKREHGAPARKAHKPHKHPHPEPRHGSPLP